MRIALPVSMVLALAVVFERIAMSRAAAYGAAVTPWKASSLVPIACALLVTAYGAHGGGASFAQVVLVACVAVCAATDLQTGYVFDRVLLAAAGLLTSDGILTGNAEHAAAGALAGAAPLLALYLAGRGRWIGLGDVKLAGVAGLALGIRGTLLAFWVACVSAGAVAAWLLVTKRARLGGTMRLAPYLAAGACIATLAGASP